MLKNFAAVFALVFAGLPVYAHPHVWIDTGLELVIEGNMIKGFWAEWAFDEMMTAMVLSDAPVGPNGQFSPANVQKIRDGYFQNLSHFGYFSYAWQDKVPIPLTRVTGFDVRMSGNKLFYRFYFPIERPIPAAGTQITLSMYDETYYSDLGFRRVQPVKVSGIAANRVSFQLAQNPQRAYWGGQIYPEEAIITIRGTR